MKFEPMTEEQLQEARKPLQPGIYDFEVRSAEEKTAKSSGKPMIELNLIVYGGNERQYIVFDYLPAALPFKLKHLCDAVGLSDKYQMGYISDSDLIGKAGKLKTSLKRRNDKDYPVVVDYIKDDFNDEIPF